MHRLPNRTQPWPTDPNWPNYLNKGDDNMDVNKRISAWSGDLTCTLTDFPRSKLTVIAAIVVAHFIHCAQMFLCIFRIYVFNKDERELFI